jgi:hypothetical protein
LGIIAAMPFDFAAVTAPFRMQPGLRRLAPDAQQLTPQRPGDRTFEEKLQVLRSWPQDVLVAAPDFDARPALAALSRHAALEHPAAWIHHDDQAHEAVQLGWRVHGSEVTGDGPPPIGALLRALPAAWRAAGLLSLAFAEDLAILDGTSARIPWIAACLPSHWAPADKVGRHFAEVHAPVADNQLLLTASEHLARLVTGTDRWERFVWTVTACPSLQMHPSHIGAHRWPEDADASTLAAVAFFRTEHQTFVPVPALRQAIFTIGVQSRPLADAVRSPQQARHLHEAIASMSAAVLAYRGLVPARDRLLQWLAQRAGDMRA